MMMIFFIIFLILSIKELLNILESMKRFGERVIGLNENVEKKRLWFWVGLKRKSDNIRR